MELSNDLLKFNSREIQVIKGMADGRRYKEIAADLDISPKTVELYVYKIMKKLDAKAPTQVIAICIRMGLIE